MNTIQSYGMMQPSSNTPSFGAKIRLKSSEIKDVIANIEDTKLVKEALDSFLAHEPEKTVAISRQINGYNNELTRTYIAENLNNGKTFCDYYNYDRHKPINEEIHFSKFLKSLMNNVNFWKDAKPTKEEILHHKVFEIV